MPDGKPIVLEESEGNLKSIAGSRYEPPGVPLNWCEGVALMGAIVPDHPTREDAASALAGLRRLMRTFAFADASTVREEGQDVPVIDPTIPPGRDESTALAALLTAVCRPSLPLEAYGEPRARARIAQEW